MRNVKTVSVKVIIVSITVVILALIIILGAFATVPAGYRGVLLRFGKVAGVLNEGLNMKIPLIDSVVNMSVQTQKYEVKAEAASKDLQTVDTSVALNYRLDPAFIGEIYQTLGTSYIDVVAAPAIQEVVKSVTARYDAQDMILRRADVKTDIDQALLDRLAQKKIIVETISITNFQFSADFAKAIEDKVVAAQAVFQAQNKLEQIKVEAQQAEATAKGQAAATIANANGQAQAIQIVTDAQVAANTKIAATLNKDVLEYILIDRLGKDVKVVVVPAGDNIALGTINP
jgi:regulator of protease activity HflC (stomatin/prohibitin superfamily)